MFKPFVLIILSVVCALSHSASAFVAKPSNAAGSRDARDADSDALLRRKAELRATLQAQKLAAEQDRQAASDRVPPGRQLSDQDRAKLRQQIRLQRP
jgi:hypothetical protein